jgi:hypothetical protein
VVVGSSSRELAEAFPFGCRLPVRSDFLSNMDGNVAREIPCIIFILSSFVPYGQQSSPSIT